MRYILPIVEGHAEVESIPIFLRRIASEIEVYNIKIAKPFRVKRNKFVRDGELERAINQGIKDRNNIKGIVVILDADDDCPKILAQHLLLRCMNVTELPSIVILAKKELEGWFLGGKESLRGYCGISHNSIAPSNPEEIRGAKEQLSRNMENNRRYLEVDDQPSLAARLDFELTQDRCPSFKKFYNDSKRLIRQLNGD